MNRPALILGAEPRVAVSVARCLGRHGLTVDVATLGINKRPLRSRWVRSTLPLDRRADQSSDDPMDPLASAIEREGYDHLVVTSDTGLRLLNRYHERLPPELRRCIPTPELMSAVLDKSVTVRLAAQAELPVPATWRIPDVGALNSSEATLRFPMVAKPADKRLGEPFKVRYLRDLQELRVGFDADANFGHNLLFQEFIPGEGVGVEVLIHNGEPVCAFQHRRLRELPWAGGISVVAESEAVDPILLDQAVRLLRTLQAEGLCMVEYRRDRSSGKAVFMEVNARAYGSLSLSELCGVEFPWYHWQLLHDQRTEPPSAYRTGLRWRWSAGVLLRLDVLSKPGPPWEAPPLMLRESLGALRDLLPPTRDALWSWTDPLPAILENVTVIASIAKRRAKAMIRLILPAGITRRVQAFRNQPPAIRSWLWRRRTARTLGQWQPDRRLSADDVETILFVCHGNIFRSPMCEYLLRRELERMGDHRRRVVSAGLRAKEGNAAHPQGVEVAAELGIDLGAHRAQPVLEALVQTADLVIVMDFMNEAELLARFPSGTSKTVVIGDLVPGAGGIEVPDPYDKGLETVRQCYLDLHQRVAALGKWLDRGKAKAA